LVFGLNHRPSGLEKSWRYRASVDSARAALAKAEANVAAARMKADRLRQLAAIDAVSKQGSEDKAAALKRAEVDAGDLVVIGERVADNLSTDGRRAWFYLLNRDTGQGRLEPKE
jgi:hypothetical protein